MIRHAVIDRQPVNHGLFPFTAKRTWRADGDVKTSDSLLNQAKPFVSKELHTALFTRSLGQTVFKAQKKKEKHHESTF